MISHLIQPLLVLVRLLLGKSTRPCRPVSTLERPTEQFGVFQRFCRRRRRNLHDLGQQQRWLHFGNHQHHHQRRGSWSVRIHPREQHVDQQFLRQHRTVVHQPNERKRLKVGSVSSELQTLLWLLVMSCTSMETILWR